ncbi:dihydrodipicolinate synthase family protein [Limimaricola pyoseonensis]|uniref:4-hydroxy-tetrahydrodipicolinate synthase n=1 Tax=Limimaricola pyoseonensis TaxID=521013 RepID=A0A1G7H4V6_9RHOB|nr:dihydrodipicolinate synthase family protein [Limimaricola pyoseonensis]SDE95446.1 4-hydroxy-tetrahydrodipicolinate synthase [Limimaricola pyoseonensis]
MTIFTGLSAFPITPADAEGRVDADALSRLLERLCAAGVDSIGLLGSTGGYAYLSREERGRAVSAAAEAVAGRVPLIAGVGALRTDTAMALAREAEKAGADGLLLAPMSYTPLTDEEVHEHFRAVAAATSLPLCIYNNPGTTHFRFGLPLLQRLADLPGVEGVKMPLPAGTALAEDLAALRAGLPEGFAVGYSGDWGCTEALLAGADAWFSVAGGLWPGPTLELARAAQAGDRDGTARIEAAFMPLWELFKEFGSLRVVHAAANLMDLTQARPPRPILPLTGADLDRVAAALARVEAVA